MAILRPKKSRKSGSGLFFCLQNGHILPKNQNFKNPLHDFVDITNICLQTKNWDIWSTQCREKCVTNIFWTTHFWGFSSIKGRKCARRGRVWQSITHQPCKIFISGQKHFEPHNPNFKIYSNQENSKFWPWTPHPTPVPLKSISEGNKYNCLDPRNFFKSELI